MKPKPTPDKNRALPVVRRVSPVQHIDPHQESEGLPVPLDPTHIMSQGPAATPLPQAEGIGDPTGDSDGRVVYQHTRIRYSYSRRTVRVISRGGAGGGMPLGMDGFEDPMTLPFGSGMEGPRGTLPVSTEEYRQLKGGTRLRWKIFGTAGVVLTLALTIDIFGFPHVRTASSGDQAEYWSVAGTQTVTRETVPAIALVPLPRSVFAYAWSGVAWAWGQATD